MKVFVGLSGGVDSSVSAALLQERGFDVVGCFIKIWQPEFTECTWREDRLDAMRVAASLSIPFKEIDLSEAYKQEVVAEMIREYEAGRTPNPDVLCNRTIKFGAFAKWAFENGADRVATGHYARVQEENGRASLLRGIDRDKDQSYFLWQLRAEELPKIMFPVGDMPKSEVRRHAERLNLPVAKKPDSQGLCFVGNVTIPEFLSKYIVLTPGTVLNENGDGIGVHTGASTYTIGQRHGFTVPGSESPLYVVATRVEHNTITVSSDTSAALKSSLTVPTIHWIHEPAFPVDVQIQARYHEKPAHARIDKNETYTVTLSEPHILASGQSAVIYDGDTVLGGFIVP